MLFLHLCTCMHDQKKIKKQLDEINHKLDRLLTLQTRIASRGLQPQTGYHRYQNISEKQRLPLQH